jgi:prepilin-type N-terminal cleavage/methylation domain-containing protein
MKYYQKYINKQEKSIMKKNELKRGFKKGFTLIELLIVMIIISILSSHLFQPVATFALNLREDSFEKDIQSVVSLQEKIKTKEGVYAYFDYTSTENNSVFKAYDDYSFFIKMKETRIKVEETYDVDCYILTAVKDDMKASYRSCLDSRLHFVKIN